MSDFNSCSILSVTLSFLWMKLVLNSGAVSSYSSPSTPQNGFPLRKTNGTCWSLLKNSKYSGFNEISIAMYSHLSSYILDTSNFEFSSFCSVREPFRRMTTLFWLSIFSTYAFGGKALQLSGTISSNSSFSISSVMTSMPPWNYWLMNNCGKVGHFV